MVDRLAAALGMEAAELRRRNLYREGSFEPTGQPLPAGVGIQACLERCVAEMRERGFGTQPPVFAHIQRGVGLACGIKNVGYSFGYPEQSTAAVELSGEHQIDHALIRIGAADVGQGTHLALRQIAAETLGLRFEQVHLLSDDSSQTPNAGSASASRLTLMAGRAVQEAARSALRQWREEERPARATVQYRPPATTALDPHTGYGHPNYCYGYVAQAVEVDVNTLTGNVQVRRVISVHDVGRVINRQQVEGQIEGCLAQALGYALLEHLQIAEGRILTPHLSSYLLPTTLDMPDEIIPIILEEADPNGPFGARGMAEMPLVPLAAAISNAIADATGARLTEQPMTPERVLDAIIAGAS